MSEKACTGVVMLNMDMSNGITQIMVILCSMVDVCVCVCVRERERA